MLAGRSIILGNYRPYNSYLHRLDARAKMLPAVAVLVLALISQSIAFALATIVLTLVALLSSGISLSALARNYRPVLVLVSVTAFYHLLFSNEESGVLLSIFGFDLTSGAVFKAGFFSSRLILFVSMAFVITLTNSPSELAESVARLLKPLARLKVPVNDLALILFIALRFIPILADEFVSIRNAQLVRGVRFDGTIFNRLKRTTSLLLPVFVSALARADDLAIAIEARGYDGRAKRTSYGYTPLGWAEYAFMFVSTVGLIVLHFLTRELWLLET